MKYNTNVNIYVGDREEFNIAGHAIVFGRSQEKVLKE